MGMLFLFCASLFLHFHNISLYKPAHGFDGVGHVYYIEYLVKHHTIPAATADWETHQSPLYYIVAAIFGAKYLNLLVFWGIIAVVGFGLWRVFQRYREPFFGMLALAALPMLNIFPAMVTNELLSTFFMISTATACLFLVTAKTKRGALWAIAAIGIFFVLGMWTKVSSLMMLPTILISTLLFFKNLKKDRKLFLGIIVSTAFIALFLGSLVFLRVAGTPTPSNLARVVGFATPRKPDFFYRMDWIPKVDMYTTQYYSLWGGAYNSFFNDGQNVITPFIKFHKKAFVLWSLGFILLPLSVAGLVTLYKKQRKIALIVITLGISMLLFYVYFNYRNRHYSAVRLTYEMPIVLAYAFGIATISRNKYVYYPLIALLFLQFSMVLSFFWILPWWHVAK